MQGEEKLTSNELLNLNKKKIDLINKLQALEDKKAELKSNANAAVENQAAAPPSAEEVSINVTPNI